jgi:hypothetical protein
MDALYFDPSTGRIMNMNTNTGEVRDVNLNQDGIQFQGGSPAQQVLNTAAIANTQRAIDELPRLLAEALARNQDEYEQAEQGFDAQEQQQRGQYDQGTVTNQQNYDANLMASIRAGIRGLSGLMSMLRGSRGTAQDEARRVVSDVTSDDIRAGAETQKANQSALDNSLSTFLTALQEKRGRNKQALLDNESAIRRGNAAEAQKLNEKMAELYASGGDNTRAAEFLARAGEQTPLIAQYSNTPLVKYDTSPINVTAPELTAFRGATQPEVVNPAGERGQIGAGIFTLSDARKRLAGQAV